MELRLPENIKRFRKEKSMTQEKLAEILGVTVGAVSKWENGNNSPDILVLMELADIFDISVDVLLGYDMTSKKQKDIEERINSLTAEHRYEEAKQLSRDALYRYPNSFSIIFSSAMMYHFKTVEEQMPEDAKMAVKLFERAKDHLDQNQDAGINDFVIDSYIASDYLMIDEKIALERFKRINFGGMNNAMIALVYLRNSDVDQSLKYSTYGLIGHFGNMMNSVMYMAVALSAKKSRVYNESSLELIDMVLQMIKTMKKSDGGYFSKLEAMFYILKAYIYACLGNDPEMQSCTEKCKRKAVLYDENSASNNLAADLKYYFADDAEMNTVDTLGENAVQGIHKLISQHFYKLIPQNKKMIDKLVKCWESIK